VEAFILFELPEMIDDMKTVLFRDEHRLNPLESIEIPSRKLNLQ
jgi:hypothetical protein